MSNFEFHLRIPFSPRAKFGIKTALLLVLLVAIGLGAYKWGRRNGIDDGYLTGYEEGWNDSMSAKVTKAEYRVYDMLSKSQEHSDVHAALDDFLEEVQTLVEPNSWERNGGPASLSVYPQNFSLIVHQTGRGHEALKEFIAAKEDAQ
ncbi:hypothetical protein [Rhodopirellula bahusiensis]|uniref:Uncharacterized protein n=1 Tax=Rhodopirellula bahusiensis TaxID=2014065 RepID=A0A2G1WCY1_9BACT|nr:hypothetical protein [Rhodopirellula bahusiensis]PHQ36499.1 hypothetical protein CEE69_03705 [Rhodopirellula bahusiensis]